MNIRFIDETKYQCDKCGAHLIKHFNWVERRTKFKMQPYCTVCSSFMTPVPITSEPKPKHEPIKTIASEDIVEARVINNKCYAIGDLVEIVSTKAFSKFTGNVDPDNLKTTVGRIAEFTSTRNEKHNTLYDVDYWVIDTSAPNQSSLIRVVVSDIVSIKKVGE